jgi:hypothetical protein
MNKMEQLLLNLPRLKHLELQITISDDIADGHRWQILASSLITFNFKFNASYFHVKRTLDSFRTPFWLEEKRWYVACQDAYLYSVPHFAPVYISIPSNSSTASTAPDYTIIYDRINKITVEVVPTDNNYRFTQVKTLQLRCSITLEILDSFVYLNQIEYLSVSSLDDLLRFIPLEWNMPQLHELAIENTVTLDTIKRIRDYQFGQIRKLHIGISEDYVDYIIEELFCLFPHIENLIYTSRIHSQETMIHLIDRFNKLSNASFCAESCFSAVEQDFCHNPNLIIQRSRRLTQDNCTCRIYHTTNHKLPYSILWRIDEQVSLYHKINLLFIVFLLLSQ